MGRSQFHKVYASSTCERGALEHSYSGCAHHCARSTLGNRGAFGALGAMQSAQTHVCSRFRREQVRAPLRGVPPGTVECSWRCISACSWRRALLGRKVNAQTSSTCTFFAPSSYSSCIYLICIPLIVYG